MNQRGYSWLTIRAVDEEKRIIEGIATTPTQARDGDILETAGIQFKLPLPFLWRHTMPFGNVIEASVDPTAGIKVRIQVGAPGISTAIDEQWRMVKAGIVRGLSIGWRTLQEMYDKEIGGYRIVKSEWMELSAVPVPADPNATITSVRSASEEILAALGQQRDRSADRPQRSNNPASRENSNRGNGMKTTREKIAELEARRAPIETKVRSIMEKVETETREMNETESTEYDQLGIDLENVDKQIRRLETLERAGNRAVPIRSESGSDADSGSRDRAPARQQAEVKQVELPKGTNMARAVICMIRGFKESRNPIELAQRHYPDTPQVMKYLQYRAAVAPLDSMTQGAAAELIPAATELQGEFLELLRPATIIGRIPGLRRVPFNVAVKMQTGGGSYGWVGEGRPKPVTSAAFDKVSLKWAKTAALIIMTQELARFSSPQAETLIRDELVKGTAEFLDTQFVDESVGEVPDINPASITNNISPKTTSGSTADAFRFDINQLAAAFITDKQNPAAAVLLISATTAFALSQMVNALGQAEFPTVNLTGGTFAGLPVVVSENIGDRVILVNARDILLADDGAVDISMSDQASVEMQNPATDDSPADDTVILKSLWQHNLIGLRVERFITWKRARTSAVQWLDSVAYTPAQPGSPA